MPARHDILCGALDFLWKSWGSIELWERPITAHLREAGVVTQLVTDHPHLFETGGENYHTDFHGWEYVRGHEGDPWRTWADPSWVGAPERGRPGPRSPAAGSSSAPTASTASSGPTTSAARTSAPRRTTRAPEPWRAPPTG